MSLNVSLKFPNWIYIKIKNVEYENRNKIKIINQ